jgi:ATP-dependent exoDNAse (exonuclease V) alpha subunit
LLTADLIIFLQVGISLGATQKEALAMAVASKVMVITGGPGVGKTTLLNSILVVLSSLNVQILLAAPTGRAAKKMSESTAREASTIHRLLGFQGFQGGRQLVCVTKRLGCCLQDKIEDKTTQLNLRLPLIVWSQ